MLTLSGPPAITWAGDGSATNLGVTLVSNMAGVQIKALRQGGYVELVQPDEGAVTIRRARASPTR